MNRDHVAAVSRGLRTLWAHPRWEAMVPSVAQAALRALEAGGYRIVWGGATWRRYSNHASKGMVYQGDFVLAGQITWADAQSRFPHIRQDLP